MKVLITGGHFSPAYSIIDELKKRGHEILIAGRKNPFEGDPSISYEFLVSEKEGFQFFEVKTGRFQRKFTSYTLTSLLKTPLGLVQAVNILKKAKPDVVMTFGGYIGLPISYAAALLNIPVVLHEQTQGSGLASRLISKIARKVCISFEGSAKRFDMGKVEFTGNPLRREVFAVNEKNGISKDLNKAQKVIYITGGSTGSHFINVLIEKIADKLLSEFSLIHQTGDSFKFNDYERLVKLRDVLPTEKKKRYIIRKFIYPDEVGFVLKKSDLILSRSGANIVFEIMAHQKPSLLIPLPHGQTSEQLENAKLLNSLGISEYILQDDITPETVLKKITEIFRNKTKYMENMEKTKKYIVLDAAEKIADIIESYGKKSS